MPNCMQIHPCVCGTSGASRGNEPQPAWTLHFCNQLSAVHSPLLEPHGSELPVFPVSHVFPPPNFLFKNGLPFHIPPELLVACPVRTLQMAQMAARVISATLTT